MKGILLLHDVLTFLSRISCTLQHEKICLNDTCTRDTKLLDDITYDNRLRHVRIHFIRGRRKRGNVIKVNKMFKEALDISDNVDELSVKQNTQRLETLIIDRCWGKLQILKIIPITFLRNRHIHYDLMFLGCVFFPICGRFGQSTDALNR